MSKYTEAIEVLKRNKPTSDPRECGRELCNAVDVAITTLSMADKSLAEFVEALQIADRLEQADAEEMAIRIGCSKCHNTMCRRNSKYEGEQDLFEVGCDLFRMFKNDAILVLADIRGDAE